MRRRSEGRLVVMTRSFRAPTSCFNSAVFSSFSLASGRAIRSPPASSLNQASHIVGDDIAVTIFFEMNDRPLPAHRGRTQPLVRIHRDRMPERGEKRQIVVRVGIAPAIFKLHRM